MSRNSLWIFIGFMCAPIPAILLDLYSIVPFSQFQPLYLMCISIVPLTITILLRYSSSLVIFFIGITCFYLSGAIFSLAGLIQVNILYYDAMFALWSCLVIGITVYMLVEIYFSDSHDNKDIEDANAKRAYFISWFNSRVRQLRKSRDETHEEHD